MKILVAQADAQARGGAEAYVARLSGVLAGKGHEIGHIDVRGHQPPGGVRRSIHALSGRSLWNWAQVCRVLPKATTGYDAVVLGYGEGPSLPLPTLTIRHAPALFSTDPAMIAHLGAKADWTRQLYVRACRHIGRIDPAPAVEAAAANFTITNSRWTANAVLRGFRLECDAVLYPPVDSVTDSPPPPPRRAFGIVAVGRIVPNKRLEDAIELTDKLRLMGYPATLAIIGRGHGAYLDMISKLVATRPHVRLMLNATNAERALELRSAALGFHGYHGEHFGIAVAEMILAGLVPIIHDSGGARELVPEQWLRFSNLDDATRIADRLLGRPDLRDRAARRLLQGDALKRAVDFEHHAGRAIDRWLSLRHDGIAHAA